MTIGPEIAGGRVYYTQWGVRAIEKAKRIRYMIGWPENPILLYVDKPFISVSLTKRVIAITMQQDTYTALNYDIDDDELVHRMTVDVHVGHEYIVVCRQGDRWEFNARPGNDLERVIIYGIMVRRSSLKASIPIDTPAHLLAKCGHTYYVVADLNKEADEDEYLDELTRNIPADISTSLNVFEDEVIELEVQDADPIEDVYAVSDILLIPNVYLPPTETD